MYQLAASGSPRHRSPISEAHASQCPCLAIDHYSSKLSSREVKIFKMSMTWAIGLALGFSMITFNKIVHCHGTNLGTNIRIVQKNPGIYLRAR